MHPTETHQLSIQFVGDSTSPVAQLKDDVKNWLLGIGEESFVEGTIDHLFLDLEYDASALEQYEALGGDDLPLAIYKYDREHLENLQRQLESNFPSRLTCQIESMQTTIWMDGWKDSFKPISTRRIYIYPPWLADELPADLIPLVIEPGMAFGTGQHATTVLCLEAIESLEAFAQSGTQSVLDVGTGTGILAIAAVKLGFEKVQATDIDPDSIIASRGNAEANGVDLQLFQGTFPPDGQQHSVVVANIIFYVLRKIINDLSALTSSEGFLILSGLLTEEMHDMRELAQAAGLAIVQENTRDDWACQIYRKV